MTCYRSVVSTFGFVLALPSCGPSAPVKNLAETPIPVKEKAPGPQGRGEISSISLPELFTLQQAGDVMIYDARPKFFYRLGHIPGAISLPKSDCARQIAAREGEIRAALGARQRIVVYCTNLTCPDALAVATHLASFGHSSSILPGGWESWKESELPTE